MELLFLLLALAAFVFALCGLFTKVRHGILQAALVVGFALLGAAHFWGVPLKTVLLSLLVGLIIASGIFVRVRM